MEIKNPAKQTNLKEKKLAKFVKITFRNLIAHYLVRELKASVY